jgi:hypothetical protein
MLFISCCLPYVFSIAVLFASKKGASRAHQGLIKGACRAHVGLMWGASRAHVGLMDLRIGKGFTAKMEKFPAFKKLNNRAVNGAKIDRQRKFETIL